jgi:hypothetical protein
MRTSTSENRYLQAKERVDALKGLYISGFMYCIIIPVLIYINYQTTSFPWAIFPAMGWGFGLIMQAFAAKGIDPLWGKQWQQRKIAELMKDRDF